MNKEFDDISKKILETEFSEDFIHEMKTSMITGFYEYGKTKSNVEMGLTDAIKSAENCIMLYRKTGNRKYLIDGSNFFMMEAMTPIHPKYHVDRGDLPKSATDRMEV